MVQLTATALFELISLSCIFALTNLSDGALAFAPAPRSRWGAIPSTKLAFFSSSTSEGEEPMDERRLKEFVNLEPLTEPQVRKQRKEEVDRIRSKFVSFGNDLWDLRQQLDSLVFKMVEAISLGDEEIEAKTRKQMLRVEQKDAELVYMLQLAEVHGAYKEGRDDEAKAHKVMAMEARSCLPKFNLEGLWCGMYDHSEQLINVTYVGDTLIATKVTGDHNVPRGEKTFEVDLHPVRFLQQDEGTTEGQQKDSESLEPVQLSDEVAKKLGTRQLPRYKGKGQIAEENFKNNQWIDGQLVIAGENNFSFVWSELHTQILFSRPSDPKILQLLKSPRPAPSVNDPVNIQLEHVSRCIDLTNEAQEDAEEVSDNSVDEYGCLFFSGESCFE